MVQLLSTQRLRGKRYNKIVHSHFVANVRKCSFLNLKIYS